MLRVIKIRCCQAKKCHSLLKLKWHSIVWSLNVHYLSTSFIMTHYHQVLLKNCYCAGKLRRNRYKCKLPIKRDRQSWVSPEYGMMQWYCTYNIHHTYTEGQQRHLLVSSVQCRAVGDGRGWGSCPRPQILTDQLTLSQPGGQRMIAPHYYYPTNRIFRPSYGPVQYWKFPLFLEQMMLLREPWSDNHI